MPISTTPPVEGDAVAILADMVRHAVRQGASDIHLEPKVEHLQVRFRIDGTLYHQRPIAVATGTQVVSRVKVLARMDIAERRVPQDGQCAVEIGPTPTLPEGRVHLRASTFPCSQGEKAVLRLLVGQSVLPFSKLGLEPALRARVAELVRKPQGIFLATGPTGSGKTSTLYALLSLIDTTSLNVVTLEDPIEVELPALTQGQTHVRAGFTFAAGLRAILRQDPDIILLGEVRDPETAAISLQAALTGHLVLSTLHTSDAVEAVTRLVDLGVEPWIIANTLSAVLAQRLVRVPCAACSEEVLLETELWDEAELLLPAGSRIVRPRGCSACHGVGYRGRTGIFEVLTLDDDLRELVKAKASLAEYRTALARKKHVSLRRAGFHRALAGQTTIDEVTRVT